jgi:hypothetical protein
MSENISAVSVQIDASQPMLFAGRFNPPERGITEVPIKLIGDGYCEVTANGLHIQGFKQNTRGRNFSNCLAVLCIVLFRINLLMCLFVTIVYIAYWYFICSRQSETTGEVVELLIPWGNVPYVRANAKSDDLVIQVKKFRHQKTRYAGGLFFSPADDKQTLLEALQSHGVRYKRLWG